MTRRKNARSLDEIADRINALERTNVIAIGNLLLEAQSQCDHGKWLAWLEAEFEWSWNTASRFMKVAERNAKFPKLQNLKLAKTVLYALADHEPEEELPAIIKELAKHATKTRLTPRDATRLIDIVTGRGRQRFGNLPDATLAALVGLDNNRDEPWYEGTIAALRERKPATDKDARSIINDVYEREMKNDSDEIDAILDGPPPLPPPTFAEPQKLSVETSWSETEQFAEAIEHLRELRAKPVTRFVGQFAPAEVRAVADFLMDVAAADKAKVD